jgi:FAD/FMN-containing dehydrogenase
MTSGVVGSNPGWETLQAAIGGQVALPGSPAYERWHRPFNLRFEHVRPRALVRCSSPDDVSETISFIRQHGLEHGTRSGGHCFGGRSSTSGVVIDLTPMNSVSASAGEAIVGAGARLGDVYEALQEQDVTIPAGTCPPVGIAGLTLGGGLGILGRTYGVTSDLLVRAQIVLADGRIIDCDENHDGDLFWALRGAGTGSYGVVTSLAFRTVPAPEATNFHLAWPAAQAPAVIDAWQHWAPRGPDGLAASLKVTSSADVDDPVSVDVYAAILGAEPNATELVDELVVRAGSEPGSASQELMSFPETRRFWANLGAAEGGAGQQGPSTATEQLYLVAKSEFFRRALPAEAITALLQALTHARAPGESRELDFMPWGGAYNRVPPDATAFVHRDELFQLKHAAVVEPTASPGEKAAAHRWAAESWASVHPWGSGRVFPNFADPDLPNWAGAYYGTNYDRLVQVKARYDPSNFFAFHQSLPVR